MKKNREIYWNDVLDSFFDEFDAAKKEISELKKLNANLKKEKNEIQEKYDNLAMNYSQQPAPNIVIQANPYMQQTSIPLTTQKPPPPPKPLKLYSQNKILQLDAKLDEIDSIEEKRKEERKQFKEELLDTINGQGLNIRKLLKPAPEDELEDYNKRKEERKKEVKSVIT